MNIYYVYNNMCTLKHSQNTEEGSCNYLNAQSVLTATRCLSTYVRQLSILT